MPTRNVMLTDHQAALLDRLVASGRYQNASEAMRAGLRLLESDEARLDQLDARIAKGLADVEAGRVVPLEDALDRALSGAKQRLAQVNDAG